MLKEKIRMSKKLNILISSLFIVVALVVVFISGKEFKQFADFETEFNVPEHIEIQKFSDYSPKLKNTVGDSDIYVFDSGVEGPSLLVIGGTHPNEPAGQLTSVLMLENMEVQSGKVFLITEANKSAFTHSHPQEGAPMFYTIPTSDGGERVFKFGSRATNTSHQWPSPEIYVHQSSGQKLSAHDTRNLNRAYPGRENGNYTERVAYAITQLIIQNDITMTIDLHEASPEYMTINAIVAHDGVKTFSYKDKETGEIIEKSVSARAVSAGTVVGLNIQGVNITPETSPQKLRGLSHRELGDHTDSVVFLLETSNASQGKFRGKFTSDLIVTGEDKFYKKAEELGLLYAPPVHIDERVARHTTTVLEIVKQFNIAVYGTQKDVPEDEKQGLIITGLPSYQDILTNGVGSYLEKIK